MQAILLKRIGRQFKENPFRYMALFFLIVFGMYMVISLVGASVTIITGVEKSAEKHMLESGEFIMFCPLTEEDYAALQNYVLLEKKFSTDHRLEDESVIRVFKNRDKMNLPVTEKGRIAVSDSELLLEKRYAAEHGYHVGDTIAIADESFTICGIGTTPDYDAPYRNVTDSTIDSEQFGTVLVTEAAYEKLCHQSSVIRAEEYLYAYRLQEGVTDQRLKEILRDLSERSEGQALLQFIPREDNLRIMGSANDQKVNRSTGLFLGVIAMLLFTYVIAVFVVHEIEKDSSVIGTLYAMGVKKGDLLRHYLFLPVVMAFSGGLLGTLLGYSHFGVRNRMGECYGYFSVPSLKTVVSPALLLYGIVMPPLVAWIVNYLVLFKRLNRPALSLIRKEQIHAQKERRLGSRPILQGRTVKKPKKPAAADRFINHFRIRQMQREAGSGMIIFGGMLLSLLVMMIGLNTYTLCRHVARDYRKDTGFSYLYRYRYPEKTLPEDGYGGYAKQFKKEIFGYSFEVTLLGIEPDNPFFDFTVERSNRHEVILSSAMAQKYGLKKGDTFTVEDEDGKKCSFTVAAVKQYAVGYYMFMHRADMQEWWEEDGYNVVMAAHELSIPSEKLYGVTTGEEIAKAADVMIRLMRSLIVMVLSVSVIIFALVLYLMLKMTIDRASMSISLLRLLGFRKGEIRKMYLTGHFYMVLGSALIGVPIAKCVIDSLFPYMISNVGAPMDIAFDSKTYVFIFGVIFGLYFLIDIVLVRRLGKITPEEILACRE